jgi:hypothetical protein
MQLLADPEHAAPSVIDAESSASFAGITSWVTCTRRRSAQAVEDLHD